MGQPKTKTQTQPDPFAQPKTLFYTEGDETGLLVIRVGNLFRNSQVPVADPKAALDWCLGSGSGLVFSRRRADPKRN